MLLVNDTDVSMSGKKQRRWYEPRSTVHTRAWHVDDMSTTTMSPKDHAHYPLEVVNEHQVRVRTSKDLS